MFPRDHLDPPSSLTVDTYHHGPPAGVPVAVGDDWFVLQLNLRSLTTLMATLVEQLCETETEDWALILVVCEHASRDVAASDEAIDALIRIFSQGGPRHVRLNAARLWSVMIHNCSAIFFERTCSPMFLAVVKEVIDQRPEGHPLRDRLVETIGSAVFSYCRSDVSHPLAHLWREVKPAQYPKTVSHTSEMIFWALKFLLNF